MHFLITRRRRLGVALTKEELRKAAPVKGDVHIQEGRDEMLGRPTITAYIFNEVPSQPDRLPRLIDAAVTGMAQQGMNITGIEEVDGAYYFQSWWCRVE